VTALGLIGLQLKPDGTLSVKPTVSVNPLTAPMGSPRLVDQA